MFPELDLRLSLAGKTVGRLLLQRRRPASPEFDLDQLAGVLSAPELEYMVGLHRSARRCEFIQGRLLLRQLLDAAFVNQDPRISVSAGPGPPRLSNQPALNPAPVASISHSPGWVAAMLTFAPRAGLDLEQVRPGHNYLPTAHYLRWPVHLDLSEASHFWRLWTLWEASTKAHGGSVLTRDNRVFAKLAEPVRRQGHATRDSWFAVSCELESLASGYGPKGDPGHPDSVPRTHLSIVLEYKQGISIADPPQLQLLPNTGCPAG